MPCNTKEIELKKNMKEKFRLQVCCFVTKRKPSPGLRNGPSPPYDGNPWDCFPTILNLNWHISSSILLCPWYTNFMSCSTKHFLFPNILKLNWHNIQRYTFCPWYTIFKSFLMKHFLFLNILKLNEHNIKRYTFRPWYITLRHVQRNISCVPTY